MINKKLILILTFIIIDTKPEKISLGLKLDHYSNNIDYRYRIINRPETDEFFFGIFDGYNGCKVSDYLANILHPFYLDNIFDNYNIADALKKSFESVHESLDLAISTKQASSSLVLVLKDKKIYVANTGDSRAVLSKNSQAIDLSFDHKPNRKDEIRRIQMQGGKVCIPIRTLDGSITKWSIVIKEYQFVNIQHLNILKQKIEQIGPPIVINLQKNVSILTRVIGGKDMSDLLIPTPEVTITDISDEVEFLIMASAGIWDVISSQSAVNLVNIALNDGKNANEAATFLTNTARVLGSTENLMVLILVLK